MVDFAIENHFHCVTAEEFAIEVPSSAGGFHRVTFSRANRGPSMVNWNCTCKGFWFRKDCRHVREAKKSHCGWMSFIDGDQVLRDEDGHAFCPRCGGPVKSMRWAV